jgi:hypothetical protein
MPIKTATAHAASTPIKANNKAKKRNTIMGFTSG